MGRYKTKALLIVAGVRKDGYREILGLKLAENEREDFWMELFEELKEKKMQKKMGKLIQELEEEGLKRAASTCERYIYDLYNYHAFPEKHWSRIKTTTWYF